MTLLALDYGVRRTGLAVSDTSETLARPIETIERVGTPAGMEALLVAIEREGPRLLIVGLPRTPSGAVGDQARATQAFVGRLRRRCPIPIQTEDERFTTVLATRLRSASTTSSTDSRSAAVLLQGVLDRLASSS